MDHYSSKHSILEISRFSTEHFFIGSGYYIEGSSRNYIIFLLQKLTLSKFLGTRQKLKPSTLGKTDQPHSGLFHAYLKRKSLHK